MTFSDEFQNKNASFLIKLAWTVEIIAVLIGLTISIVVAVSAHSAYTNQEEVNLLGSASSILVAALPFLLIAVVELCKIPLTFAFMAVKNIFWRSLFLFFVMFLCFITFETMLNGFERNFSMLNHAIDTRKNDIENMESEVVLLERRQQRVQRFTEEDLTGEIDSNQLAIDEAYRTGVKQVNQRTKSILSDIDYSFKETIDAEVGELILIRDKYYDDWNTERQTIEDRFSSLLLDNLSDSRKEKQRLQEELDGLKAEMSREMDDATFLTRSAVERKYRNLIAAKNRQIDQITTGFLGADALQKQSSMEDQLKQQIAFVNNKYEGRIQEMSERIETKKQEVIDREKANKALEITVYSNAEKSKGRFITTKRQDEKELNNYLSTKQQELEAINVKVNDIEDKIFYLRNDQRNVQSDINRLINQNQVYRLAMYASGAESPTDVTRKMVGIVALLWFGSLALIASITGVMLCLAGFYLKRQLMGRAREDEVVTS